MRTPFCGVGTVGVVLLLFAGSAHAAAEPPDCAKQPSCLAQLNSALEQARESPTAALPRVTQLYAKFSDPRLLYHLARLQHRLGQPYLAAEFYRRYLESAVATDAKQRERAELYWEQLWQEAATFPPGKKKERAAYRSAAK